jgi:hypothetical protein
MAAQEAVAAVVCMPIVAAGKTNTTGAAAGLSLFLTATVYRTLQYCNSTQGVQNPPWLVMTPVHLLVFCYVSPVSSGFADGAG